MSGENREGSHLLVFLREPTPGRAKTRLADELGERGAAILYAAMARETVAVAATIDATSARAFLLVDPPEATSRVRACIDRDLECLPQAAGDLGQRLERAFATAFDSGARRAIAVGSDCPFIDAPLLSEAFARLERHDAVLGPSRDGGYYLLGLARHTSAPFRGIPWSSSRTFSATLDSLRSNGFDTSLMPRLADIDRPGDLPLLEEGLPGRPAPRRLRALVTRLRRSTT